MSDLLSGAVLLLRGAGVLVRRPRLFLLGALPPLVTSVLFVVALVMLLVNIDSLTEWLTPFADGLSPEWQATVRIAIGVAVVLGAVLVMVLSFTTATLALGAPIYDKISERVDEEYGPVPPAPPESVVAMVMRAVRQSLTIIVLSLLIAVLGLAIGFIPVVGQVLAPVLTTVFGAWVLGLELCGAAFDQRGLRRLRDRHRWLRTRRLRTWGFTIPVFLLLAIPFVAIAVFPAAAAGAAILTREVTQGAQPAPAPHPPAPHPPAAPPPPPQRWT